MNPFNPANMLVGAHFAKTERELERIDQEKRKERVLNDKKWREETKANPREKDGIGTCRRCGNPMVVRCELWCRELKREDDGCKLI